MTSSYGGYRVANSICNQSNIEPKPPRAANCCIVASRRPESQSLRDLWDKVIVKKISACDSSNTLVAPPPAKNKIAYSTHCFYLPNIEICTVKQFGVHRTVARALDVPAAKLLLVYNSCTKPLTINVICTRDSVTSRTAPRTKSHSALDLILTRLVSCAQSGIRKEPLAKIAQVDTRATVQNAHEYNNCRTPQTHNLVLNFPSLLLYCRRISRLVACDRLSPMSAMLDRFDAAKIFALASVDAISVEEAWNKLQSHNAVDVMIEGFDQRFTDSIMSEGCATPCLFLNCTLARLLPTLGFSYSAAMIDCKMTQVRCDKQTYEATLSVGLMFCFRVCSYYAARQEFAMFNRRFDSRSIAEQNSVCYVLIPQRRSTANGAQSSTDASSTRAPKFTSMQ